MSEAVQLYSQQPVLFQAYVGEKDEPGTMFDSMPTALYWAIITMTSVGYGDIHPVSWFGKLVGSGMSTFLTI